MRRWVTWQNDRDGSSRGRLDLKPGQEVWDSQAHPHGDDVEIAVLVEDNGQPLVFEYWANVRQTATDLIGRKVICKELSLDEAPPCKDYQLPSMFARCADPRRWIEYTYA